MRCVIEVQWAVFWVFPYHLPAPRLEFLQGKPSLGLLPPSRTLLCNRWMAKEGQAPHPVPATKTGWKTQETWAGVLPLPRGAVLLLNLVTLSYCYSWSWNTFQQGACPCPQLRPRQEEERRQLHHGTAKGQGSMRHPDVGLVTSSS